MWEPNCSRVSLQLNKSIYYHFSRLSERRVAPSEYNFCTELSLLNEYISLAPAERVLKNELRFSIDFEVVLVLYMTN